MSKTRCNSIHWFRKGLRLHDNPALVEACKKGDKFWPIFILDPWFVKNMRVGPNRWRFLVQSLQDLDNSLKEFNSRLFILRGKPVEVLPEVVKRWRIKYLTYESDTEPYAKARDKEVEDLMGELDVHVIKYGTNTLFSPAEIIRYNGKTPLTYQSFVSASQKCQPLLPVPSIAIMKRIKSNLEETLAKKRLGTPISDTHDEKYGIPTLQELNVNESELNPCLYPGGETEALKRLQEVLQKEEYICTFSKPNTSPNSLEPSTTVLSPYVKFGCLSARTFHQRIRGVYLKSKKGHTKPPVSLHGQLYWREFFYTAGSSIPHFDQMLENEVCTQIPWIENKEYLEAWAHGRTGYPFIDAIMIQLRQEGWIHHLARHAVACFLTRGDLWVSWEHGMKVFEELLLDADWSLNAGNWMWLSASAFFHQYYRVYSPIAFGKKTDKNGDYIRKYIPILKRFPQEYIYEPWKAPKKLQEQLGCVIGKDYPSPIVNHDKVRVENLRRMDAAYKAKKGANGDEASTSSKSPSKKSTPTGKRSLDEKKDTTITKFLKKK